MGKRQYSQPGFTSSVRNGRQRLKNFKALFSAEKFMLRVNKQNNDLNNLQHAEGNNSNK
jgi:hypothetical protein